MLATRTHYSIDMIAGVIVAHYLWILSSKYVYLFDFYVFGIPLEKRIGTIEQVYISKKEKKAALENRILTREDDDT